MATNNKEYLYDKAKLLEEYEDYLEVDGTRADNLESFKSFLKDNGMPTNHAKEIYDYLKNKTTNLKVGKLKIRKSHPKRDYFLKKVLVPTVITSGLIGVATSAIAVSGLISGSAFMGVLPVFSNAGLTAMATGMIGAGLGAMVTPLVIHAKNRFTKLHYKLKYKSAEQNLNDLMDGTNIDELHISELMEKIDATSHKIFELNSKHNPFAWAQRHILNTINRNRIHHLEKTTLDLFGLREQTGKYIARATRHNDQNAATYYQSQHDNINKILKRTDDFVASNVKEAKLNALLTCKEKGTHTHSKVENVDIYANLSNALEAARQHKTQKETKKSVNNLSRKQQAARKIANEEQVLFPELIERAIARNTLIDEVRQVVITGDTAHIRGKNGETLDIPAKHIDQAKNIESIIKGKSGATVIVYDDGTETSISKEKKANTKDTLVAESVYSGLDSPDYMDVLLKKKLTYTNKSTNEKLQYNTAEVAYSLKLKINNWLKQDPKARTKIESSFTEEEAKLYSYMVKQLAKSIESVHQDIDLIV